MKRSRLVLLFLIAAPALALAGTIFLLFAYANAFDPTVSHYFSAGSALPVLGGVLLGLSIMCGVVGAVFAKKNPESLSEAAVPFKIDLLAALGALGSSVWLLILGKTIPGVLMIFAAIFFTLCAGAIAKIYGKYLLWGGFAAIAATIAWNATYYFDMTVEMNAPTKILLQMAFLAAMLFITAECRLLLGRFDCLLIPILTVLCVALCISAGAVDLYLLAAKKDIGTVYLAAAPFLFCVGMTALGRLIQMLLPKKQTEATAITENENPTEETEPAQPTESEESDE